MLPCVNFVAGLCGHDGWLCHRSVGLALDMDAQDEVGRGEAVGGVYMLSGNEYDTTALCIRDSELVRMSKVWHSQFIAETVLMRFICTNVIALDCATSLAVRSLLYE